MIIETQTSQRCIALMILQIIHHHISQKNDKKIDQSWAAHIQLLPATFTRSWCTSWNAYPYCVSGCVAEHIISISNLRTLSYVTERKKDFLSQYKAFKYLKIHTTMRKRCALVSRVRASSNAVLAIIAERHCYSRHVQWMCFVFNIINLSFYY